MSNEWTPDQLKTLKKLFPGHATQEVAEAVGKSVEATKKKASRLGLQKSAKYRQSLKRS
jgi:hypothetical protein